MDALQSLSFIELTDREQFRSALQATMVKDPVHNTVFNNAFEAFFVSPDIRDEQMEEHQDYQDAKQQVKKDLEFQSNQLDLDEHYLDLYMQLPEDVQHRVKDFVKKTAEGKNVTPKFRPIVENVIKGALNYQRTQLDKPQFVPVESTGEDDLDAVLYKIRSENNDKDIFYRDMDRVNPEEYGEMIALIRKLARRLADTSITANALHPGFVATNVGRSNGGVMGQLFQLSQVAAISPEKGAETSIYLASSPEVEGVSGAYFSKCKAVRASEISYNREIAEQLWQRSTEIAGLNEPAQQAGD
jgi:hypothetical protein